MVGSFVYHVEFVLLGWGFIFFCLFLQEIFTGSFKFKDHRGVDIILLCLLGFGISGFLIDSFKVATETFRIASFASLGIAILLLSLWEVIGASRLIRKTSEDRNTRVGLWMIALSGLVFVALIGAILANTLENQTLNTPIRILMFAASLLVYMGYIYPSRQKKVKKNEPVPSQENVMADIDKMQ